MASTIAAVRDAVKTAIAAGSYARTLNVSSDYRPGDDAHKLSLSAAKAYVRQGEAPPLSPESFSQRDKLGRFLAIEVHVIGRVTDQTADSVDEVLEVAEQIEAVLRSSANARLSYPPTGTATWVTSQVEPIGVDDQPEELHLAQFLVSAVYHYEVPRG